jgi:hypothetical protein
MVHPYPGMMLIIFSAESATRNPILEDPQLAPCGASTQIHWTLQINFHS